ncbi:hypothetical protein JCM17960_12990 [Magnetospira thiophila]
MRTLSLLGLIGTILLGACSPVGMAVDAGSQAAMASQEERGLGGAMEDLKIRATLFESWFSHDHTWPAVLTADVYQGQVLITGVMEDADDRAEALRRAWAIADVRAVYNEIQSEPRDLIDTAWDKWVSAQLGTRLTFDKEIHAINYQVTTVNGTVYLLGHARSRVELDRVLAHARDIEHVRKVISHVKISRPATENAQR